MTIEEIIKAGYKEHHSAMRRGYESRKCVGHAEPYKGRFGEGYVWISPLSYTTRYVLVTYFVK